MKKEVIEESIKTLVDLGLFIRFDDSLKLYHGRAAKDEKEATDWQVDPNFNNGDNATGNRNVSNIPMLYTASPMFAQMFADARVHERAGKIADTKRIVSSDKQAIIINDGFNSSSLTSEQKIQLNAALKNLISSKISEMAPLKFEDRFYGSQIFSRLMVSTNARKTGYVTTKSIDEVYESLKSKGVSRDLIVQIAGSINARTILKTNPVFAITRFAFGNGRDRKRNSFTVSTYGEDLDAPLNQEYVASWLVSNHIVGCKHRVISATLGREMTIYGLFDLEKVNTMKAVGDRNRQLLEEFEELANVVSDENFGNNLDEQNILKNGSPQEIIEYFEHTPISQYLKQSAGVWEGFSVGQHTETALRIFDKDFADEVPNDLLPFMRVAILSHDIGKGEAVKNNEKYLQKSYTQKIAPQLYAGLGISEQMQKLLQFVIGNSQTYTTDYYINKKKDALKELYSASEQVLKNTLKRQPTAGEVCGLSNLCKIMQICDSGAYTRRAVTRDENLGFYYNGNDRFTSSFKTPTDLAGTSLHDIREP